MAYLNTISIIGNLGREPKIAASPNTGVKKASFSVACTERYKGKDGEQQERTDWFSVVCWGKLADVIERLALSKGTCVYVGGKMTFRTFDSENGEKRQMAELVASTVQILTPRNQRAREADERQMASQDDDLPW